MSRLTLLAPGDATWRGFAREHARSPFQLPGWIEILVSSYGLTAQVAALVDDWGEIVAGLPLIRSKLPWRRRWTALPFTDALDPIAVDGDRRDELLRLLAASDGLGPVVVHSGARQPGWANRLVGTRHEVDLSHGAEHMLANASRGHRRSVARARRAGFWGGPVRSREEFLGPCLGVIARSRNRVGVPTQPRCYWSGLWDLSERGEAGIVAAWLDGDLVSTAVFLISGSHAVVKHAAADRSVRLQHASHFVFMTGFEDVHRRGVRTVDFGVSDIRNEGLHTFKARWGAVAHPVYYSATDSSLLPSTIEPGPIVTAAVKRAPVSFGRALGTVAYAFTA